MVDRRNRVVGHSPVVDPMVGTPGGRNRVAGNSGVDCNRATGNPRVGTLRGRTRVADNPVLGNPGSRAAACSPGEATVVVDHGSILSAARSFLNVSQCLRLWPSGLVQRVASQLWRNSNPSCGQI